MKSLIVLVVGLLSVGCATLRDRVVGEYEWKGGGVIFKHVFLENGIDELYSNGKKSYENKWSIVDGEIHIDYGIIGIDVWRINQDKSIALIASIEDGKRTAYPKDEQATYKKIK